MRKNLLKNGIAGGLVVALAVTLLMVWSGMASAADVAAGQTIYKKRCAVCHGQTGAADTPMAKMLKPPPPNFTDPQWMARKSDDELTKKIVEGVKPRMPSFGDKLSAEQIQNVAAYIRTLVTK